MTPEEFKEWRLDMGFTQAKAGDALGISRRQIINYEKGVNSTGIFMEIPKVVDLACKYLVLLKNK